jgi:hypothetical protein
MGELAWLDYDPALPALQATGPMPVFNIVKVMDQNGERTIYHTGDWVLADTVYINGGAQLALLGLTDYDETGTQQSRWLALNRDGSVNELLSSDAAYSQMIGAPGGYALFELFVDDATSTFSSRLSLSDSSGTRVLWESEGMGWELAGGSAMPESSGLSPFQGL